MESCKSIGTFDHLSIRSSSLADFLHDSWRFNNPMSLSQWILHSVRTCTECHFAVMLQSPSVRLETESSARMRRRLANLHFKMFVFFISSLSSIDRGPPLFLHGHVWTDWLFLHPHCGAADPYVTKRSVSHTQLFLSFLEAIMTVDKTKPC